MKTRVLVVDDESDTLNLMRTILDIGGFAPIITLNSLDALTLAEVEKPDVVLLDIMMPNLDGFALCKLMRAHPATKHLPIVFVTAYSALDLQDRKVEAGADLILHKPLSMDSLIRTIHSALQLRPEAPNANNPGSAP
jgi:DNA-binding response OmpR family regulator